ncbi:hypothetical protein [Roseomonas marmotae]|uniref:FXSXX-COOH protein n=1 Tax=Roseomonas marmotae TaxID=2768161 RepID=A0ABS3KFD8_9PROT|nr:hypothetical protein [Roseomonas marmotae]MBO1076181.1 hypothetical protein [Roseomonas marmotae]QTI81783.1 hypothetical protein IAI58_20720 [Roseomonas marmotae]
MDENTETSVHIEEIEASVSVMDDAALLSPDVMRRVVAEVMARMEASQRSRGIALANTRLGRSAALRPDRVG